MKYKVNLKNGSSVVVDSMLKATRYFVGYAREIAATLKTDEELQQFAYIFSNYLLATGKVEIINA